MMKHEPLPNQTAAQADVATPHKLHRDYEARSQVDLKKVGLYVYAKGLTASVQSLASKPEE
jgi:endo-1,4-beta-mannosidase